MADIRSITLSTDPPIGWPQERPWPPFGTGPTFPVPTEPDLLAVNKSGPRFFALQPAESKNEAQLRAYNAEGIEWGKTLVQKVAENRLSFTMSQANVAVQGAVSVSKLDNGMIEIKTTLNRQTFTLRGFPDDPTGASVERIGAVRLGQDENALLQQFGDLRGSILGMGLAATDTFSIQKQAKRSCASCLFVGAAVVVGGGCCATLNPGCCVGALAAAAVLVEDCQGACA